MVSLNIKVFKIQLKVGIMEQVVNKYFDFESQLSSSGPGPGQVQVRSRSGRSEIDLSLTLFLVFTTHHHHKLFSWLLWGLDMSDGPRMGWYDSSRV